MGHAQKGVIGAYDRHTYDAEKADALQMLANRIRRRQAMWKSSKGAKWPSESINSLLIADVSPSDKLGG
jgi:hypothetical protein